MTSLAGGVTYPSVKFAQVGQEVLGTIVDFADVQERDFNTKEPKVWPDGSPVLQVRVTLEVEPGNFDSRVNLYISGKRMKNAVREALANAGASDITPQAKLGVQFTGYDGPAKTYRASYVAFDPTA